MSDKPNAAGDAQRPAPPAVANLRRIVVKKKYDELEPAWMAALDDPSVCTVDLLGTVQALLHRNEPSLAETLFWLFLTDRADRLGPAAALDIVRQAAAGSKSAETALPESGLIRDEVAALYRRVYPDIPHASAVVEMTVLRPDVPLSRAISAADRLLALTPGSYVLDIERKVPGRVTGLVPDRKALEVSFPDGPRTCDAVAAEHLQHLDADDFRARLAFEPDSLAALAAQNAAELVALVLKAHGPFLTFRELRAHLTPILPGAAWSKWWADARPLLKRAPLIQMSDDAQPTFGLRARPVAYEDDLKAQFLSGSGEAKAAVVLDYVTETAGGPSTRQHEPNADMLAWFAGELAALAESVRDSGPLLAAAAAGLTARIHKRAPDLTPTPSLTPEALVLKNGKPVQNLGMAESDPVARFALTCIREAAPEQWPEVFAAALPGMPTETCGWVATELSRNGFNEALRSAVPPVLARADESVGALIWLWRATGAGEFAAALGDVDRAALAVRLLGAADSLSRRGQSAQSAPRLVASHLIKTLAAKDHQLLRSALDSADPEQVKLVRTVVERCGALSDHARNQLVEVVRRAHPGLFVKTTHPWDEDVIYTTAAGLKRRQQELYELVNVKLAEAVRLCGKAAEAGDLSENFDWTAALAERDRVATTATRMQAELAKARLIPPTMPGTESVTVGSAVDVKDPGTGAQKTFIFLGPWDAAPEKGVFAYLAPVGLAFMGKKPGETVTVSGGGHEEAWHIVAVRPAPGL